MKRRDKFIFRKKNYYILLTSLCLIVLGYILMSGDSNHGGTSFNTDIYNFRRITLAPLILITGYGLIIYSIMVVSASHSDIK